MGVIAVAMSVFYAESMYISQNAKNRCVFAFCQKSARACNFWGGGGVFCIDDESQVVRVHTNWFQVQFPGPLNIMVSPSRYCLSDRGRII